MRHEMDLSGDGWRLMLDPQALWQDDPLHLPPFDLDALPVRPPSGGWSTLQAGGVPVAVPGTVEEHFWDERGDYVGVSWWWRSFTPPAQAAGRRALLRFEAVRLRAEVFLNQQLVGYDAVGNTPFEVDLTGRLRPGEPNLLAVRVTDPGGNFIWVDPHVHFWGKQPIPASHGFGGITGPVRLRMVDPLCIGDVFIVNKPAVTELDVQATIDNTTGRPQQTDLRIRIAEYNSQHKVVFDQTWCGLDLEPGQSVIRRSLSVPAARPWSPEQPHLYVCRVSLGERDEQPVRFGFRWFAADGIGKHAVFRLNGKRVVLRSAISWGFWPINGIFPTRELAKKQIRAARALGLNMLNFHRAIGQPLALDLADELGLLYYEEPGGYASNGGDELCLALAREKLLRMVRRDRSHPSLVIYSMINEETKPPAERHQRDMADAHRLDPTRIIVYTSGWAKDGDDPVKLHMRPFDDQQYIRGWYDVHHADGPGVYRDQFYNSPKDYRLHTDNTSEIVFWGEEGAIGTPPRLEKIVGALRDQPNGWDGADYRAWFQAYEDYLDRKNLRQYFPSVDLLTESLGNVAYYYHGRTIENIRLGNLADGYAINGWEAEKIENHSGIVDCFRNPKGDPGLLAWYNQPLYVAVKVRTKVAHAPAHIVADFYIINEAGLRGTYRLLITVEDHKCQQLWSTQTDVQVSGGDTFGELLTEGIQIELAGGPGRYTVRAALLPTNQAAGRPQPLAAGHDEVFLVDWKSEPISTGGAILEASDTFGSFLREHKDVDLPAYSGNLPPLDYVIVGDAPPSSREVVPAQHFTTPGGSPGLLGQYYKGVPFEREFTELVFSRTDAAVDFEFGKEGPDPRLEQPDYSIRWTGLLTPPESGAYRFFVEHQLFGGQCPPYLGGVRLWVDDRLVVDRVNEFAPCFEACPSVRLEAGHAYRVRLEYHRGGREPVVRLGWTTPTMQAQAVSTVQDLVRRVRNDGTTLLVLEGAADWARLLADAGAIDCRGCLTHGRYWLGGNFFVREHPLLADLPVNQALNWEYQVLVHYGVRRFGLLLEGEEAVVGSVTGHEHTVATAVGVIPCGRGRIVLSTLDLAAALNDPPGPADVARKLLCNYLGYAGSKDARCAPK